MRLSKLSHKPKASPPSFRFEAIGTQWQVDIAYALAPDAAQELLLKIQHRINAYDKNYSRFRDDSLVAKMAQRAGKYELPADAQPMLDMYARLYSETKGAVTPLIGQLLSDAGYDAQYSLRPSTLHTVPTWEEALDYNFPHLTLKQPVLLDFGAIGKGYLVDIIDELLHAEGVDSYCINAGGDILQRSEADKIADIGLEHPDNTAQVIGVAKISNQSLCGSAGNRRAWGDFHHIIDPHSHVSPRHIKAVWVTAKTALLADALTTGLFFVSPAVLAAHYDFEYAIIYSDNSLTYSAHFPAHFFN